VFHWVQILCPIKPKALGFTGIRAHAKQSWALAQFIRTKCLTGFFWILVLPTGIQLCAQCIPKFPCVPQAVPNSTACYPISLPKIVPCN
jgi:hypothetical protein